MDPAFRIVELRVQIRHHEERYYAHNAPEMAYAKATEYATRAKSSLEAFPPSREREALAALADYVLSRDR